MAVSDEIEARIRRAVTRAFALAAAGLVLATAAGFLLAALYLALRMAMEPVFACLVTAGVLLVLVLAILGLSSANASRAPAAAKRAGPEPSLAALLAGEDVAASMRRWSATHRREQMIGVFVCGFALGFSPRLRRALARWLRG